MRWDDARRELLPLYRMGGVPASFLETHDGALSLYGAVAAAGVLPEAELREVQREASRVIAAFEMEVIPHVALLPPAVEFIRRAPELALRLGIVTSNALQVVLALLEREGLVPAFEAVVAREHTLQLKPSPEGLLLCCARMGVVPAQCIYVGDSATDIEAAHAAGMTGFGVQAGNSSDGELTDAGAVAVFDDLSGLPAATEGRN